MPPVGKDKIETQRGFAGPAIPMRIDTPVTALQRTCLPQTALVPSDWFVHVETIGAAVPCCSWKNGTLQVEQPPNQPALLSPRRPGGRSATLQSRLAQKKVWLARCCFKSTLTRQNMDFSHSLVLIENHAPPFPWVVETGTCC